jgi:adenosylhomocysteine nucleosidase
VLRWRQSPRSSWNARFSNDAGAQRPRRARSRASSCTAPARAAEAARRAIEADASALLSFGIAGGLRSGIATGAVILPNTVIDVAGALSCDPGWCTQLADTLGKTFTLIRDPLVSIDHVATTLPEKQSLAQRHEAAAVDMESAAIAREAAAAGLPFAALRVVADGSADALPRDIESLVTADGRTHLPALLGFCARPQDLPALIRLGRRSGRARAVLARVAETLAREGLRPRLPGANSRGQDRAAISGPATHAPT